MKLRAVFLALASTCVGLLVALAVLEVFFRFMPVSTGLKTQPVTSRDPVFNFEPNREFTYSQGWNFAHANRLRVNNAGFVNEHDYDEAADTPLLAVIGDSYVEALIIPAGKALHGRLARAVSPRGRVYSFAASGAPLSQYLVWAQHAHGEYRAAGAVFVVVGNDFDESLAKYKTGPGFHHFVERDGRLELRLYEYRPSSYRPLVYSSALGSYLVFNLKIQSAKERLLRRWRGARDEDPPARPRYVGNTAATASDQRIVDSRRAVDAFFDELEHRLPIDPGMVVFVVDGVRAYDDDGLAPFPESYFARMRRYFMDTAESRGHVVVDMQPVFEDHYRAHGERFEHADDAHWNALAHELAARAVSRTDAFRSLFPGAAPMRPTEAP